MSILAILGRQPQLGLAELLSRYGNGVKPLGDQAALINDQPVNLDHLGGTIKIAELLTEASTSELNDILEEITPLLIGRLEKRSGKQAIGLSVYGLPTDQSSMFRNLLSLKKRLAAAKISSRVVTGENRVLNAAHVIHNRMLDHGAEIVMVREGSKTWVGLTTAVQDIASYSKRDYDRPARSAKVGMLPPKLAQIMINFASPQKASTVLDPFCGTGVILQEAALMGLSVAGSDIEPELIQMSQRNLDWLTDTYKRNFTYDLEVGDARTHQWQFDFDCAVTEGYLGPALTKAPSDDELVKLIQDASSLTLDFLGNLRQQIAPGVNICMTLPAWKHNKQFKRLEILDQIQDLGYTLKDFSPVSQSDLLYFRPDQIVAREIITLRSI